MYWQPLTQRTPSRRFATPPRSRDVALLATASKVLDLEICTRQPSLDMFSNISDAILKNIIQYFVYSPRATTTTGLTANPPPSETLQLRLVNKRFSELALPLIMHTLSVCCIRALETLLSAPYSPLYHGPFLKHVRCFEIRFNPFLYTLSGVRNVQCLPKSVEVVKFSFEPWWFLRPGGPGSGSDLVLEEVLSMPTNDSCVGFLAQFNPKRFEWVVFRDSGGLDGLRILRVDQKLRSLFTSWTALCSVTLDGVCLVEQLRSPTTTPRTAIFVPTTTTTLCIRGPIEHLETHLRSKIPKRLFDERVTLVLESRLWDAPGHFPGLKSFMFGSTRIIFCGWSDAAFETFTGHNTLQKQNAALLPRPPLPPSRAEQEASGGLWSKILRFVVEEDESPDGKKEYVLVDVARLFVVMAVMYFEVKWAYWVGKDVLCQFVFWLGVLKEGWMKALEFVRWAFAW